MALILRLSMNRTSTKHNYFMKKTTHASIVNFKVISLSLFLLFSFQCALAQTAVTGKIIDVNDDPVAFATIRLGTTNVGTVSNASGKFQLVLNNPSDDSRLVISSIGYQTATIKITEGFQTIVLQEDINQLNQIVIIADNSRDYAKELIEKAIKAIPQNYPNRSERHTGFLRESTTWDQNDQEPIYIAEAVVKSIKEDYRKRNRSGDVELIEFRKYKSTEVDSLHTRIYAGSHHIHRFDMVARREAFLSKPDNYNYTITDTLRQDGKDIYEVLVEKKNENSARVYIQDETFAIVKADITLSSNFGKVGAYREFFNFTVTYKQSEDRLWRFSNSYYTTAFRKKGRLLNLISEYVTTDIDTQETKIPYVDRLQFSEILLDKNKAYNPNFWDNYTIISPDETSEALFASIDYSKLDENGDETDDIPIFVKKMSFEYGLSWTAIDIAASDVSYTHPDVNILQSNGATTKGSASVVFSLFYELKPHFLIGYTNEGKLSRTGSISNDIILASNFNLNPNGRPIRVSPRLHFGYQRIDQFLERFEQDNDININGEQINGEKVDAFLYERGFRLKPNVVFSVEQSKRLSFSLSVGYNISFDSENGVLFLEKKSSSFFPKRVFVENGDDNLNISSNQERVLQNTFSLNAGIAFRF